MNPNSTPEHSQARDRPDDVQRRNMDKVADPRSDAAGRGGGLPARGPQLEREPTGEPTTPKDASIKSSIRLPHERDEDTSMTGEAGSGVDDPKVGQAARDLDRGLKDTSRANETDRAYHRLHESSPPPDRPGAKTPSRGR